jgi:hypothetical protein
MEDTNLDSNAEVTTTPLEVVMAELRLSRAAIEVLAKKIADLEGEKQTEEEKRRIEREEDEVEIKVWELISNRGSLPGNVTERRVGDRKSNDYN